MIDNSCIDIYSLILSLIIGILLSNVLNINNVVSSLVIIIIIYMLFLCLLKDKNPFDNLNKIPNYKPNLSNNKESQYPQQKYNNNNNNNNNNLVKENKEDQYYNNQSIWRKKNKSPFDGLLPKQLINRINYLYYATSHPFKAKSYTDFIHNKNNTVPKSVKHLNIARTYYPQLTEDQVNFSDCLNFPKDHPLSCNQGDDKWESENSIMKECELNANQKKTVNIEDKNQIKYFE